jgi:hypothetical protein
MERIGAHAVRLHEAFAFTNEPVASAPAQPSVTDVARTSDANAPLPQTRAARTNSTDERDSFDECNSFEELDSTMQFLRRVHCLRPTRQEPPPHA